MAEQSNAPRTGRAIPVPAIIFAVLFLIGGALAWYLSRPAAAPPGPVLTGDAKAYVQHLALSDVEMKAHKSYLNQKVVEITGNIANNGNRALRLVEVYCIFYDPYGQVVLRERAPIVRPRGGVLAPGETRPFRLPFDELPETWNQGAPQLVIAQIVFE